MQIIPFLTHYQSVFINFDLFSFSRISYYVKGQLLPDRRGSFT